MADRTSSSQHLLSRIVPIALVALLSIAAAACGSSNANSGASPHSKAPTSSGTGGNTAF
jgi:ABC-type Na+ efflux pump permease subunit